ncbi:MAG: hypothetical protein EOP54_21135, partial [Sphingobacteriales bacterium]
MLFDRLVTYFMPGEMRKDKIHPRYHEFHVVVSSTLIGIPLVCLFPVFLVLIDKPATGYYINAALLVIMLLSIKHLGHYRIPMTITALATYFIIYDWIATSGQIYSPNISVLHMYLLAAVWADKKHGWYAIFTNLLVLGFIYYQTVQLGLDKQMHPIVGTALYSFGIHSLITIFFGGFLAYLQYTQHHTRQLIHQLQDKKINLLDEAVKKRTEQLNSMRQTVAT